jgi:hypothetical protein
VSDDTTVLLEIDGMGMDDMGVLNNGWGICGFTSSLYALYQNNPTQRQKLAKGGRTSTRMLAEIKTYLRLLQAEKETELLSAIQTFTRSFGGIFSSFTIPGYIEAINRVGETGVANTGDRKYSIAIPPDGVVDYLRRVCGFNNATIVALDSPATEYVMGVSKPDRPAHLYNRLAHYMYALNGTIYSWGQTFNSITAANAAYSLCYKISIHG